MNIDEEQGRRDTGGLTAHDVLAIGAADLAALHARLAATASSEGLLDVAYRMYDSPVGTLLLAATDVGLVRVAYANQDFDLILQDLANRISPRVLAAPARLDPVANELDDYFTGTRHEFDVDIDWRLSHGFRQLVLERLPSIGYGQTATYADVAELAGNPRAVRAVGTACATNPIPVVVPCHRVVRSDGALGGYLGGPEAKTALLGLEAVE